MSEGRSLDRAKNNARRPPTGTAATVGEGNGGESTFEIELADSLTSAASSFLPDTHPGTRLKSL